jgi:hypothetical protein
MSFNKRIVIAVILILAIIALILGGDYVQRKRIESRSDAIPLAGSVPIYVANEVVAHILLADLEAMPLASFVDTEEEKIQEGWLLADVLQLYIPNDRIQNSSEIIIRSASRDKAASFTWEQISAVDNMLLFDLSGRGTLKLVSQMPGFDTRANWIQDVDEIEVKE